MNNAPQQQALHFNCVVENGQCAVVFSGPGMMQQVQVPIESWEAAARTILERCAEAKRSIVVVPGMGGLKSS